MWAVVCSKGDEWITDVRPVPNGTGWSPHWRAGTYEYLPKGSIEKLIGRELRPTDSPVKLEAKGRRYPRPDGQEICRIYETNTHPYWRFCELSKCWG